MEAVQDSKHRSRQVQGIDFHGPRKRVYKVSTPSGYLGSQLFMFLNNFPSHRLESTLLTQLSWQEIFNAGCDEIHCYGSCT